LLTRRRFLYTGAVTATCGSLAAADGFYRSNHPEVTDVEIFLSRLPEAFDGFTIAQLSDFHYEDHFSVNPISKAVDVVNGLHPDLIVLTGDFVTVPLFTYHTAPARRAAAHAAPCAQALQQLHGPAGVFAILGNHDAGSDAGRIVEALESHRISVLLNRAIPIERGTARIWLSGIDDVLEGRPSLGRILNSIPQSETNILLAHEPDFADEISRTTVDLQLSGHSHGGQVWIPGVGAPWLPQLGRKYPRGIYKIRNLVLYTNIGIGTIRMPIRLNCPPEITLITLRSGRGKPQAIRKDPNKL